MTCHSPSRSSFPGSTTTSCICFWDEMYISCGKALFRNRQRFIRSGQVSYEFVCHYLPFSYYYRYLWAVRIFVFSARNKVGFQPVFSNKCCGCLRYMTARCKVGIRSVLNSANNNRLLFARITPNCRFFLHPVTYFRPVISKVWSLFPIRFLSSEKWSGRAHLPIMIWLPDLTNQPFSRHICGSEKSYKRIRKMIVRFFGRFFLIDRTVASKRATYPIWFCIYVRIRLAFVQSE